MLAHVVKYMFIPSCNVPLIPIWLFGSDAKRPVLHYYFSNFMQSGSADLGVQWNCVFFYSDAHSPRLSLLGCICLWAYTGRGSFYQTSCLCKAWPAPCTGLRWLYVCRAHTNPNNAVALLLCFHSLPCTVIMGGTTRKKLLQPQRSPRCMIKLLSLTEFSCMYFYTLSHVFGSCSVLSGLQ